MLEDPGLEVRAVPGERLDVEGVLKDRARRFARSLSEARESIPAAHIEVRRAPLDHVGLGTGTQLALAVATALTELRGERAGAVELARHLSRGGRSAIGIHGFEHGGFLIDGGKKSDDEVAPLIVRRPLPEAWRFVLAIPPGHRGLSGSREAEAFRRLPREREGLSDRLCHLLLLGALPALAEGDLDAFGGALTEYGRRAAEFFQGVQGGVFCSSLVEEIVDFSVAEGAAAVGQSSWGPATFALVADDDRARHLASRLREKFGFSPQETFVTRARNRGASVSST